jgi:hypothetical protein
MGFSLWLSVLIVGKSLPRDPRDPPYHIIGGVWCIIITPAAQKVVTDAFNGFMPLPVTQKSAMQHRRRSQRRILGREPGTRPEPAPTTHGGHTDGIRPAAGPPTTPRGCRRDHACAGGGGGCARRAAGKWERGGAACRTRPDTSIPALHSCPGTRAGSRYRGAEKRRGGKCHGLKEGFLQFKD